MNKFNLISVILVFGYAQYKPIVNAKRISELKCDETASLLTDSRSINPYLMEVFIEKRGTKILLCFGSLISKDFVLTSAQCISEFEDNPERVKIRKVIFPVEQYSNSEIFGTKRLIQHDMYNDETNPRPYNFGLIQLNGTLFYHNTISVFRPACLWSKIYEPFGAYQIFSFQFTASVFTHHNSLTIRRNEDCNINGNNIISTQFICFNTSENSGDSPVIQKVGNQIYIFGNIISNHVFKISNVIEWIENIVWPIIQEDQPNIRCGERKRKHSPYMAFAQPSYHAQFPWHIALYRDNHKYICGGTIISSRAILTAGHCVHDERGVLSSNRFIVLAGTHSLIQYPIQARNYTVKTVIVHENYNRHYLENDIALLKLSRPIEFSNFIQPICISNDFANNNITKGTVAGWGRDEHNQLSNWLLHATLPIVDEFTCRHSNRDFFSTYLNSCNYCAGYDNGTSACAGDSGGAMIFQHKSQWYIRGIVSIGVALKNSNRCDITEFLLFTDVPKFYDWIHRKLEDEQ